MIRIDKLSKSFRDMRVLDRISLDIPDGEITVIIGPSGTGKSVLLKHILGLMRPDSGSVFIDDRDISAMKEKDLNEIRKHLGVCFQDAALFDSMTVGENIAFPFRVHTRLSEEEIMSRVSELLKEVGLSGIEDKMPSEISGGMRKRVGLARALALNPRILLFDEPTTGLDPVMSTAINLLIRQVQKKSGATCLVISHDIKGAFEIADYMAMLYKGKIVFSGRPVDFNNAEEPLVRQFIDGRTDGPINPNE